MKESATPRGLRRDSGENPSVAGPRFSVLAILSRCLPRHHSAQSPDEASQVNGWNFHTDGDGALIDRSC
jgi:hypothetical protein